MQNNINLDDGKRRFTINSDPSRVIEFCAADMNILSRLSQVQKNISAAVSSLSAQSDDETEAFAEVAASVDAQVRKEIDYIFDGSVSDAVFGNTSPLALDVKGVTYAERFLTAITPVLESEIKAAQAASEKRMAKHLDKYNTHPGKK